MSLDIWKWTEVHIEVGNIHLIVPALSVKMGDVRVATLRQLSDVLLR